MSGTERLQDFRLRRGITQDEVAEELIQLAAADGMEVKVDGSVISKWERGKKRPHRHYRRLLCRFYQATEEDLGFKVSRADVAYVNPHQTISGELAGEALFWNAGAITRLTTSEETMTLQRVTASDVASRRDALAAMTATAGSFLLKPTAQLGGGPVIDRELRINITVNPEGHATVIYYYDILNNSNISISKFYREVWFEHARSQLKIASLADENARDVLITPELETPAGENMARFYCNIMPALEPGKSAIIRYKCDEGRFVDNHYWKQRLARPTSLYVLDIFHEGISELSHCEAIIEDDSGHSTLTGVKWDRRGGGIGMQLTQKDIPPNRAITFRWDAKHA